MLRAPEEIARCFGAAMTAAEVDRRDRGHYVKWLRFFLDFCAKYRCPPEQKGSLGPFIEKLASKNQSAAQRQQATRAVRLYLDMRQGQCRATDKAGSAARQRPAAHGCGPETPAQQGAPAHEVGARLRPGASASPHRQDRLRAREAPDPLPPDRADAGPAGRPPCNPLQPPDPPRGAPQRPDVARAEGAVDRGSAPATGASWVKVLDDLRNAIRPRNSERSRESSARSAGGTFRLCSRGRKSTALWPGLRIPTTSWCCFSTGAGSGYPRHSICGFSVSTSMKAS